MLTLITLKKLTLEDQPFSRIGTRSFSNDLVNLKNPIWHPPSLTKQTPPKNLKIPIKKSNNIREDFLSFILTQTPKKPYTIAII